MKKALLLSTVLIVVSFASLKAQTYKIGDNTLSAGIGLGSSLGSFSYGSQSPAISLQYEKGLWKAGPGVISLGGYVGYKSYSYSYHDLNDNAGYDAKWKYTIVGVRSAWHYTELKADKLDLYGGLMLSYNHLSFSANYDGVTGSGSYGSDVSVTAFVGGRYYFSDKFGGFAELGYGVAYLNLGLAYKF